MSYKANYSFGIDRSGEGGVSMTYYCKGPEDFRLHREDGPAIEYSDGHKVWCFEGEHVDVKSQEEFERWLRLKAFW